MKLVERYFLLCALSIGTASTANAQVDPLTAKVDSSDAERFAEVWREAAGQPNAAQLQSGYLDHSGRGVAVFTPGRIENAEWLAQTISENPDLYRDAIERCLPWVAPTQTQLRATYLGFKGLFPDKPLPEIAVVIGANNSGGTAAPGIQVIGLEVICRLSPDQDAFEKRMRQFFAHETVHTFQSAFTAAAKDAPLVAWALREGVPDYITSLITANIPNLERHEWAVSREAWLWSEFQKDAEIVKAGLNESGQLSDEAQTAFHRWFANAGNAPQGWPDELGYWIGMRIAEHYVSASSDPKRAIEDLIDATDPAGILLLSAYGPTENS